MWKGIAVNKPLKRCLVCRHQKNRKAVHILMKRQFAPRPISNTNKKETLDNCIIIINEILDIKVLMRTLIWTYF